ncbi:MAG: hypothetical protein JW870_12725 [Candidatus Delongbacteria bacterium]|nr:hypothetical protein [Candidatus Delongbacteria bacterium]
MALLVRMINRNKWPQNGDDEVFEIPSDAITNCLKSTRNTLSVWKIEMEDDLDEAVLALVANFQHLESIDVIVLDGEDLVKANVKCEKTKGITPVKDLEDTHFDLCDLNYFSVGLVAEHIAKRIKCDKIKRYNQGALKRILKAAIAANRLKLEDLTESVAKKIGV